MKTRIFFTVSRVTSPRKAGSITTAPLMISFTAVSPGVDQSDALMHDCSMLCPCLAVG